MKRFIHAKLWLAAAGATLLVGAAGCGRDNVKVYHVDASDTVAPAPPPVAPPAAMPTSMPDGLPVPDNSGQPTLQYTLPAGWEKKTPGQMRVASFGISQDGKQADVSVIPLAGMAGTDPANVNRWRGQVALGPLAEADVSKLAEKVSVGDQPADLYDLVGTVPSNGEGQRILGVILHRDDTAWFFKMTGETGLVEQQKPAFTAFLKSVSFGPPAAAPSAMDLSQLPPSHPPIEGMSLGTQNSLFPNANQTVEGGIVNDNNDKSIWTVPSDWQLMRPSQFLIAEFSIIGTNDAKAEVNVAEMSGDGGGLVANVNRWRGQLGLPPVAENDLPTVIIQAYNDKEKIVDFTGRDPKTGKPAQLIGAIVHENGQTWFYKLMGDETLVAQQREAFIKFIRFAKYPDAH